MKNTTTEKNPSIAQVLSTSLGIPLEEIPSRYRSACPILLEGIGILRGKIPVRMEKWEKSLVETVAETATEPERPALEITEASGNGMKKLSGYIGQAKAKETVNDILTDYKEREKDGRGLPMLRPFLLEGIAGLGKTEFALAIAEAFGWQFIRLMPKFGWGDLNKAAAAMVSVNTDTGAWTAIPTVILVDECHEKTPTMGMVKMLTEGKLGTESRNGTVFYRDLSNQLWIFASNEKVDPAISSRCEKITLTRYTLAERKKLITLYCDRAIEPDALDYLANRVKQTARECKGVAVIAQRGKGTVTLEESKKKMVAAGIWPEGFLTAELKMLQDLSKEGGKPLSLSSLKIHSGKQGGAATDFAKESLHYMYSLGYVIPENDSETRWSITEKGGQYLERVAAAQKKA